MFKETVGALEDQFGASIWQQDTTINRKLTQIYGESLQELAATI
jgi:hypothetical protein